MNAVMPVDMNDAAPLQPVTDRIVALDALRGAALFGVLLVNLESDFRASLFQRMLTPHTHAGWLKRFCLITGSLGAFTTAVQLWVKETAQPLPAVLNWIAPYDTVWLADAYGGACGCG